MKRLFILLLAAILLLCSGCSGDAFLEKMQPEDALYSVDGEVVVTAKDLSLHYKNLCFEAEHNGEKPQSLKKAFKDLCQLRLLSHIAEKYGYSADKAALETEFLAYMEEIGSDAVYSGELAYANGLREALGMDENEYMDYNVRVSLCYAEADALISGFAENYTHLTDGSLIAEEIEKNLTEYIETSQTVCSYPGLSGYIPKFTYLYGSEE